MPDHFWRPELLIIETHSKEKILFAYLFEVLGQEAKMIQITGDVKTTGAETIPISVNLLVRNVLPCDDMLFSSERPLTIERVFVSER